MPQECLLQGCPDTDAKVRPTTEQQKLESTRTGTKAYQHFIFLQKDVCGLLRYEKLMVIVHVISGDSPLVHITGINSRVRIMVLNLQARTLTCSSHTYTAKGYLFMNSHRWKYDLPH